MFAPVLGDDVVDGSGHDKTSAGGVGAVKEDVVVDSSGVSDGGVGYVDKPALGESSFHGGVADFMAGG